VDCEQIGIANPLTSILSPFTKGQGEQARMQYYSAGEIQPQLWESISARCCFLRNKLHNYFIP